MNVQCFCKYKKKKKIIFKKQLLKYPYFYKILKNNLKIVLKNMTHLRIFNILFMNHIYFYNKGGFDDLMPRLEISINMDISILGFYRYIKNISKISMDVLIKMSIKQKLFKIHGNV